MQARTKIMVVVAIVGLAACTGTDTQAPQATAAPTTTVAVTTTTTAGPAAFVTEARAMNFGNKDFATATDDQLLAIGNTVCNGLGNGLSFGQVAQGLGQTVAKPTTQEATIFAMSAVRHLCPQYETTYRTDMG